ncbi:hypothetical protein MRX96_035459 [Rhipicephalus microplus]
MLGMLTQSIANGRAASAGSEIVAGNVTSEAPLPASYSSMGEIVCDFCREHEVTLIPSNSTLQETSATFAEMFHSCGCLTAYANIESLRERHQTPPWNLVLFPDPVKIYKVMLLWESIEKLQEVLQQTSLLSSQISMACQLSFKTDKFIDVTVDSPVEISRCNVLVVDNEDAVGSRHEVAVEEHGRDYVFRLWAMGNQSSICSQCGIIQNHHGLEWYTKVAGLRLKVGAVHNAPHWRLTRIPKHHGTDSRGGIEQAYVIALSRHFNFTYDVIEAGGSKFGGLDGDTWSGMVGQIHRKEVDIAVGGLSVFYFRFLFVDFVYPYITDVFAFVSKAPTRLPLTQTIIYPFQQQVWMALFASLLVAWAGVIILRRWTPRDKLVGDAPDIWLLFATLVRQSDWGSEFRTLSFRCLLAAWLLLSLVASNSYSCLLLSFMSVPAFSPHVDTPERLQEAILAGKYTAGTSNGTAQYTLIMETREGPLAAVRSCMLRDSNDLVPNKQVGLDRAVSHNYAYIDTQRGLSAALLERHNTSIEVSTGHIGTTIMSLAMHKTCFYRNAFSTAARSSWSRVSEADGVLVTGMLVPLGVFRLSAHAGRFDLLECPSRSSRRLVESGHFLKWEREDQPVQPKLKQSQFKTIEISDVFSHGTILIAGYGLALVALVGEYARFRYVSRRRLGRYQQRPTDSPVNAIALLRPRRAKRTQRRQSIKRSSSTVAVAVPTPLPPLHPLNRPTRWETRVVGQSGFKRVSINLGPNAFPKIDSTAGQLPLEASGAGGQPRRDDRCVLPNFPTVSTW